MCRGGLGTSDRADAVTRKVIGGTTGLTMNRTCKDRARALLSA